MPVYQKLIDLSGAEGGVFVPEGGLSLKVRPIFVFLWMLCYTVFTFVAECTKHVYENCRASLQLIRGNSEIRCAFRFCSSVSSASGKFRLGFLSLLTHKKRKCSLKESF